MFQINKHQVLSDFVEINGISKSNGWAFFKGTVSISTAQNTYQGKEKVRIWFSGFEYGNVVIEITKKFDVNKFPSTFWISAQDYNLENRTLVITGIHPNPEIGEYTCRIDSI